MNEDIIRMAREAGGYTTEKYPDEWRMDADDLKRLVEIARAEEREACAKVCDGMEKTMGLRYEAEMGAYNAATRDCANAIRARGVK